MGDKGTTLSKYIKSLNEINTPFDQSWSIEARAQSYRPEIDYCNLCLVEKYFIQIFQRKELGEQEIRTSRKMQTQETFSSHELLSFLKNIWSWKVLE